MMMVKVRRHGSTGLEVAAVVIGTILFWIGIGIRQWFVFSKWTKKYKQYKDLQKKIEEKLDYDSDNDKGSEGQKQ